MYPRFAVVVFLLATMAAANGQDAGARQCPSGEVYSCQKCEATCDADPPNCSSNCKSGCYCATGTVRNQQKKCVAPRNCPSPCPSGQTYRRSGPCDASCAQLKPSCTVNQWGCFCPPSQVRNPKGVCIDPKDCPPH